MTDARAFRGFRVGHVALILFVVATACAAAQTACVIKGQSGL